MNTRTPFVTHIPLGAYENNRKEPSSKRFAKLLKRVKWTNILALCFAILIVFEICLTSKLNLSLKRSDSAAAQLSFETAKMHRLNSEVSALLHERGKR